MNTVENKKSNVSINNDPQKLVKSTSETKQDQAVQETTDSLLNLSEWPTFLSSALGSYLKPQWDLENAIDKLGPNDSLSQNFEIEVENGIGGIDGSFNTTATIEKNDKGFVVSLSGEAAKTILEKEWSVEKDKNKNESKKPYAEMGLDIGAMQTVEFQFESKEDLMQGLASLKGDAYKLSEAARNPVLFGIGELVSQEKPNQKSFGSHLSAFEFGLQAKAHGEMNSKNSKYPFLQTLSDKALLDLQGKTNGQLESTVRVEIESDGKRNLILKDTVKGNLNLEFVASLDQSLANKLKLDNKLTLSGDTAIEWTREKRFTMPQGFDWNEGLQSVAKQTAKSIKVTDTISFDNKSIKEGEANITNVSEENGIKTIFSNEYSLEKLGDNPNTDFKTFFQTQALTSSVEEKTYTTKTKSQGVDEYESRFGKFTMRKTTTLEDVK